MILSIKAGESGVITHNLSPGSIICKYTLRGIRSTVAPHLLHPHPEVLSHFFFSCLKHHFWQSFILVDPLDLKSYLTLSYLFQPLVTLLPTSS